MNININAIIIGVLTGSLIILIILIFKKISNKYNLKLWNRITKKDLVYCLIILNIIIWTVTVFKAKNFYEGYISVLSTLSAEAKEYTTKTEKTLINANTRTTSDIIREVASKKNFKDVDLLLAIATCESGLKARAYNQNNNGTYDSGIFQFNSIHGYKELPLDPYWATEKAIEVIRAKGLQPWSASKKCWQNK